jgi:hypothetical protein
MQKSVPAELQAPLRTESIRAPAKKTARQLRAAGEVESKLQVGQPQARNSRFLGLVGMGNSGRTDIASNVKEHLTEILERKFGLPPSYSSLRLKIKRRAP